MVTKSRFVIVFQSVFVVIFALGMLFPAGMVVNAEDLPPTETTETTVEEAPPEEPPPETETVVTPPEEVVVPAVEPVVEPVTEEVPAPVEVTVPTEEPAAEVLPAVEPELVPEVLPTEDPLLVPAMLPAASEGESSEEELDTPAEVLEALPAEAELVVLGENGEELPLVALEAEEALVTGDPMYCSGTDLPGSASCITYVTIEAAVAHAQTTGNGDCTIYVAQDYNNPSTSTIEIDQGDHPTVVLNMFLVGGYDLTSGSGTFGTLVGTTTLNQNFYIDDITGSLTLANFIIKEFNTNNATITISDSANVTLNNMTIKNKGNGNAVSVEDSHDVTISNSTITDKADGYGIKMTHSYDILIIKTTVNEYGEDGGIYMNNVKDVNFDTVTVDSNDNYCNGSGCSKDAIFIKDGKDVYLKGVNANSQFGSGFHSVDGLGYLSLISSVFDDNHNGFGVLVEDHNGIVYLEKVSASGNEYEGVKIQNKGDVTIKDSSILENDGEYGLLVHAKNIEIGGTHVDDNWHNGASLDAGGWIKILTSSFSDNDTGYGLNAEADGPIDISESAFDHNGWYIFKGGGPPPDYRYGAHLYSDLDITITDSTFNNNFNEGLYAEAGSGGVAPEYVSVMGGGWPPPPPPPPTIGNILLDGVTANANGYADDESGHGPGFAFGAQLYTNGTLTILDSAFNSNRDYGVFGDAEGDIKVSGTSVNYNQGWEYMDYGAMFKGESNIELLKSNFDDNYGPGLQVYVNGDILADGISASGNMDWLEFCHWMYPGYGALLDTKYGGVEISNAFFDNNEGFGLFVWAKDDVTINKTSASNNSTSGFWHSPMELIMLLGGGGPGPAYFLGDYNGNGAFIFSKYGSVVINNSLFDGNDEDGLGVDAGKDITLFKVSASGNGDDGTQLMARGNITATCSTFMDNGDWGLKSGAYGLLSSTTLNSNTFGGNGTDDYLIWAGGLVVNLDYPCGGGTSGGGPGGDGDGGPFIPGWLQGVIPVTGGEFKALSCTGISVIQLPDGEETIFNQPMCGYMASMELVTPDDLPGKVPEDWKYIDGFTVTLMFGNEVVVQLPTGASDTLVFPISEDQVKQEFHILFWDVSLNGGLGDWVDLGGVKEALKWVKTHNQTGTFLLVQ